jgi:hypothetical protein
MKVEFEVGFFYAAHGRRPRGRGGWLFCPAEFYRDSDYLQHVVNFNGTYAEARRAATAHFKALGVTEVVVCS